MVHPHIDLSQRHMSLYVVPVFGIEANLKFIASLTCIEVSSKQNEGEESSSINNRRLRATGMR
jgi:hypothetical protein